MVTPFDAEGKVDYEQAKRLANALLDSGSDAVIVSGTTGESPTLTIEEKIRLFGEVKDAVGDRGAVVAGTGNYSTAESIELSQEAGKAGVDLRDIGSRWGIDDAYRAHEVGALDFPAYAGRLSARLGIELAEHDWRAGWNALFSGTFPDVVDALPRAAARLPLYCFTNTNAEHQATWQERYGQHLTPFTKLYVSSEIGRRKPDVTSFEWVARDMGLGPADILFLDDSRANIDGAAAAGLRTVHVTGPEVTLRVLDEMAA